MSVGNTAPCYCFLILQKTAAPSGTGLKRSPAQSTAGVAAKRKHSPIRFESSGGATAKPAATGGSNGVRRQPREIYHPPRDQFSKKVSNGSFQEFGSYRGRGRERDGRRRGRGFGGSWRKYSTIHHAHSLTPHNTPTWLTLVLACNSLIFISLSL